MIKEALQRTGRRALMRKPHTVRFMGSSSEPHPLLSGSDALASARAINDAEQRPDRVLAYVDGPAFADLVTLREAWEEERPELGFFDRKLYDTIVGLVAYGERKKFSDTVLQSPYYQRELKKLPLPLRTELENFLSQ